MPGHLSLHTQHTGSSSASTKLLGVTVEVSWRASRGAGGAQLQIQQRGEVSGPQKKEPRSCAGVCTPQPLSQPTAGWPWWGLIKERVGSPPAVGVVGDWATDSPRRLQPARR